MANKMYIVYTSQGFAQDNDGNDVDNLQILETIDARVIKKEGIKSLQDAANYAKFRMASGAYGYFDSLVVIPAEEKYAVRMLNRSNE